MLWEFAFTMVVEGRVEKIGCCIFSEQLLGGVYSNLFDVFQKRLQAVKLYKLNIISL
jgi:hypothetical protein